MEFDLAHLNALGATGRTVVKGYLDDLPAEA